MGNKKSIPKLPNKNLVRLENASHLNKKEIADVYVKFYKMSPHGTLTRAEFVTLYNILVENNYDITLLAEHMFRVFAKRDTYTIDFEEFVGCLSVTQRGSLKEQIEWVFRLYDINGDGVIVISEIVEIMQAAGINKRGSRILNIFKKMDKNNDNVLSFEEFTTESVNNLTFLKLIGMQNISLDE